MNFNNFTIKAQEVVQKSIELARRNNQQAIEPAHIMKSILEEGKSIANFLFQKMGVNTQNFTNVLDRDIASFPKVSGGGDPYLSRESNDVFQKALENIKQALEVKSRRVGGSNYQVPNEVSADRSQSLALRWLTNYAKVRNGKGMAEN